MKASAFEFRFRIWIGMLIYLLGFLAPWERAQPAANQHLWSWLALQLFNAHYLKPEQAFILIAVLACVLAAVGAWLRVWATAYLGHALVQNSTIQANAVLVAGPYRYLRNPLYAGAWLTGAAVSILMPPAGALFFVLALAVFQWRLIGAEGEFLAARLGEPYREYRQRVPALIPYRVFSPYRVSAGEESAARPRWGMAFIAETYPVGVALCFAVFAWRYEVRLLTQCVLICFGASLIFRALLAGRTRKEQ
jgi:protein-S-isoprenylcysteine O-methyltransferase Ste14